MTTVFSRWSVNGVLALMSLLAAYPAGSTAQRQDLDVPYVPTKPETVQEMLRLAAVTKGELLYDLGSGDGRIVVTAAKQFGARGVGVDLDPDRIAEARENAKQAGVEDKVRFIQGDLFETDFQQADVLTMYLLPDVNMKLRPKILQMAPGTRVVSHAFDMEDWQPDATSQYSGQTVYLWVVPAQVAGSWHWQAGEGDGVRRYQVNLDQSFQRISGSATVDGQPARIEQASLRGDELVLSIKSPTGETERLRARIQGGQLVGESEAGDGKAAEQWVAQRVEAAQRG